MIRNQPLPPERLALRPRHPVIDDEVVVKSFAPVLRRVDIPELQPLLFVCAPKPQQEIFNPLPSFLVCRLVPVGQGHIQIVTTEIRQNQPKELLLTAAPVRLLDGGRRRPRGRDSIPLPTHAIAKIFFHFPVVGGGKYFFPIRHLRLRVPKIKLLSQPEKRAETPFLTSLPSLLAETGKNMKISNC